MRDAQKVCVHVHRLASINSDVIIGYDFMHGVAILIILSLLSSTPLVNSVIISNNMATTFLELGNHCK